MPNPTHTLIGRACGPEADDACVQLKVAYYSEPTRENVHWAEDGLRKTYANAFDEEATRVAVVVLPFVEEYNGDPEE